MGMLPVKGITITYPVVVCTIVFLVCSNYGTNYHEIVRVMLFIGSITNLKDGNIIPNRHPLHNEWHSSMGVRSISLKAYH